MLWPKDAEPAAKKPTSPLRAVVLGCKIILKLAGMLLAITFIFKKK